MAISTLSATLLANLKWTAQQNVTGGDYQPITSAGSITKQVTVGTAAANAAAGGSDQLFSYQITIAGGGTSTIDLTSITNVVGTTAQALARLKGYMIRLMSVADDATYGTAASSVTVGNAASNAQDLNLGTGDVFSLKNGGVQMWTDPSAAGYTVDATHKNVKVLNNDGAVSAVVQVSFVGGST